MVGLVLPSEICLILKMLYKKKVALMTLKMIHSLAQKESLILL
jgi:hypothetical protein